MCRGDGMVDMLDSKSGVSNDVPVQIRFAVPSSYKNRPISLGLIFCVITVEMAVDLVVEMCGRLSNQRFV